MAKLISSRLSYEDINLNTSLAYVDYKEGSEVQAQWSKAFWLQNWTSRSHELCDLSHVLYNL